MVVTIPTYSNNNNNINNIFIVALHILLGFYNITFYLETEEIKDIAILLVYQRHIKETIGSLGKEA